MLHRHLSGSSRQKIQSCGSNFEKILAANDIGYDGVKSLWVHIWTEIRDDFPTAVEVWSARLVVDGVR